MITRRLESGAWERPGHGVYRIVGMPSTWEQKLMTACLATHGVVSHRSAAALWSFAGFERVAVEVTALRHRRSKSPSFTCHESHTLRENDVTELNGLPVTMPARTVVDLAVVLSDDDVEIALDDALRRNLTSVSRVRTMLEVLGPKRPGTARMRRVLKRRPSNGAVPESYLETRFVQLVRSAGLPEPDRQFRVESDGRIAYLDFAYPAKHLAVELDGYEGHGGRSAWQEGLERSNRIGGLGWRALHFSAADLERRPEQVVAQIRHILAVDAA